MSHYPMDRKEQSIPTGRAGVAVNGVTGKRAGDVREVYLTFQVHNESTVVPENVDCIRAMTGIETGGEASICKTDAAIPHRQGVTARRIELMRRGGRFELGQLRDGRWTSWGVCRKRKWGTSRADRERFSKGVSAHDRSTTSSG